MSDENNQIPTVFEMARKLSLTDTQYLEQIAALVSLLTNLKIEKDELEDLSRKNVDNAQVFFKPSLPGGWFYEHSFLEHIGFFLSTAGLIDHIDELIHSGKFFSTELHASEIEPPDWLSPKDNSGRTTFLFVGLHTLHKSIEAIEAIAKPINQLIAEGRQGDRSALKLAIKLDPLAITSPTVAAELLQSDVMDKGRFRKDLLAALRSPHKIQRVNHGVLRFVLKTMHDDGRLEKLSEADRYEFFCKRLAIYPDRNFEASDSLNRFIRSCVKSFRT